MPEHMRQVILDFPQQFLYAPRVENGDKLPHTKKFLLAGMGGSHPAADFLTSMDTALDMVVHVDYGLPERADLGDRLIIASSYSGNTEETISAYEEARKRGLSVAVITVGGKLLELARADGVPYIALPDTGVQPRSALGLGLLALLKLIGEDSLLAQVQALSTALDPAHWEEHGKFLADALAGCVPVVYASTHNMPLAYHWKVEFNESAKVPAFWNVFSELNHNEMTGFDVIPSTKDLSARFHFILLQDANDDPRILKRMEVLQSLYGARGLKVSVVDIEGNSPWERVFNSLLLADWTAYHLALHYGTEPEQVPMVEEFKKMIT